MYYSANSLKCWCELNSKKLSQQRFFLLLSNCLWNYFPYTEDESMECRFLLYFCSSMDFTTVALDFVIHTRLLIQFGRLGKVGKAGSAGCTLANAA